MANIKEVTKKKYRAVTDIKSEITVVDNNRTALLYKSQAVKAAILMHIDRVCDKDHRPNTDALKDMCAGNNYIDLKDGKLTLCTMTDHHLGKDEVKRSTVVDAIFLDFPTPTVLKAELDRVLAEYSDAKKVLHSLKNELDQAENHLRYELSEVLGVVCNEDVEHHMGSCTGWDRGADMISKGTKVVEDEPVI